MVLQIHEARRQAKEDHKTNLLELARQGDRRVIGHLKRSSSASATDAGFLQRAGGSLEAQTSVSEHYRSKYTATDPTPLEPAIRSLFAHHSEGALVPITCEEIMKHLNNLISLILEHAREKMAYLIAFSKRFFVLIFGVTSVVFSTTCSEAAKSPMNGSVVGLVLSPKLNSLRSPPTSDLSV